MARKIAYLICCLLFLSSCSLDGLGKIELKKHPEPGPFPEEQKKDIPAGIAAQAGNLNIVSVGDSLTKGVGDSLNKGGYLNYLKLQLETEGGISPKLVNLGIKGQRTDQLLARLDKTGIKEIMKEADVVIITIGGNDVMKVFRENITNLNIDDFKEAQETYRASLLAMLAKVKAINDSADVYLVGLYNPFYKWTADVDELAWILEDWNQTGELAAAQFGSTYFVRIDDIFAIPSEELLFQDDYFHPNSKGYEQIGKRIYDSMEKHTLKKLEEN
ncbi:SGNH/GDSL hydrolase family protein [Peribacillus sp. SCS-37]|uniref:SGNH/GDSL hydrolase family protein n=1 Tax=Paraperibacillus esterisolvens TaxID=3115296 RepID=UPI00390660C2